MANNFQQEERFLRTQELNSAIRSFRAGFKPFEEWELDYERAKDSPAPTWDGAQTDSTFQAELDFGPDVEGGEDEIEWRRRIA